MVGAIHALRRSCRRTVGAFVAGVWTSKRGRGLGGVQPLFGGCTRVKTSVFDVQVPSKLVGWLVGMAGKPCCA